MMRATRRLHHTQHLPMGSAPMMVRLLATTTTGDAQQRGTSGRDQQRLAQCSLWQCARSSDGRLVVAASLLGFVPCKPTRGRPVVEAHAWTQWDQGFTHVSVLARAALASAISTSTEAHLTDVKGDGARLIAERVAAEVAPALVPYGTRLVRVEVRAQPFSPVNTARAPSGTPPQGAPEPVQTETTADFRAAYDLQQLRQSAMALADVLDVDPFGDTAARLILPYLLAAERAADVHPLTCAYTSDQVNDALMGYMARVSYGRRRSHRRADDSDVPSGRR